MFYHAINLLSRGLNLLKRTKNNIMMLETFIPYYTYIVVIRAKGGDAMEQQIRQLFGWTVSAGLVVGTFVVIAGIVKMVYI